MPGTSYTPNSTHTLYAVYTRSEDGASATTTESYGFGNTDDATNWTINGPVQNNSYKKTGSYAGKINSNNTYITYNEKVNVTSFSFQFMRESTNNNYNVYIETSPDNQTWTAVETYAMSSFSTSKTWYPKSHTFDGKKALYVRFRCYNTTAVRWVDDVSITYVGGATTYYMTDLTCVTETSIYLHPNFGSELPTVITTGASTYEVPTCSFTRTGYTFSHWDTKADDSGVDYDPGANIDLNGTDVNLYAQWTCGTPVFDIKIKEDNPVVFSGESIELTVVGSNIAADATYQWYKYNGTTYDELTGQKANKLTIAEATANDAGNYKCVVTNGTCPGENNYTVKMYHIKGLTDGTWTTPFEFEKSGDKWNC